MKLRQEDVNSTFVLVHYGAPWWPSYCEWMIRLCVFFIIIVASPVFAQQQVTPSQTGLQINQVIASWAQEIEQSREVIKRLTDRVKELEMKYEAKKE